MPHARAMLVQITFPVLAKVRKAAKVTAFYGIRQSQYKVFKFISEHVLILSIKTTPTFQ